MTNVSLSEFVIYCDDHFITTSKGKLKWTKNKWDALVFSIKEAGECAATNKDFFEGLKVQFMPTYEVVS